MITTTQSGDIERFLFTWEKEKIKMQLWLKGFPTPSVVLNLDAKDAMNMHEALDSVLGYVKKTIP